MQKIDSGTEKPGFWDRIGIGLSGICAIHCLLIPISVSLIPLWPALEHFHGYTHLFFFLAIAPTVYFSLKRRHSNRAVSIYLIVGLVIIFMAWLFNHHLGEYGEAGITLVGSMLLIRGHWLNYRSKR